MRAKKDVRADKLVQLLNATLHNLSVNRWLEFGEVLAGVTSQRDPLAAPDRLMVGVRAPVDLTGVTDGPRGGLVELADDVMRTLTPRVLGLVKDGLDGRQLERRSVTVQFSVEQEPDADDVAVIRLAVGFRCGGRVGPVEQVNL